MTAPSSASSSSSSFRPTLYASEAAAGGIICFWFHGSRVSSFPPFPPCFLSLFSPPLPPPLPPLSPAVPMRQKEEKRSVFLFLLPFRKCGNGSPLPPLPPRRHSLAHTHSTLRLAEKRKINNKRAFWETVWEQKRALPLERERSHLEASDFEVALRGGGRAKQKLSLSPLLCSVL